MNDQETPEKRKNFSTKKKASINEVGKEHPRGLFSLLILFGSSGMLCGLNSTYAMADDASVGMDGLRTQYEDGESYLGGLQRIEDGSIVANDHTAKWRIFTDNGRDLFARGKADEAEKYFLLALQEAKEGFGERDGHVASACNNLAELYSVRKIFDKAKPLYLEAISILEDSHAPEDIRSCFSQPWAILSWAKKAGASSDML